MECGIRFTFVIHWSDEWVPLQSPAVKQNTDWSSWLILITTHLLRNFCEEAHLIASFVIPLNILTKVPIQIISKMVDREYAFLVLCQITFQTRM